MVRALSSCPKAMRREAMLGTALFTATIHDRTELIIALLAAGSAVDGTLARRPLMAVKSVEAGRLLLAAGANPTLAGHDPYDILSTPLHAACCCMDERWFDELLQASDLDALDESKLTPMMMLLWLNNLPHGISGDVSEHARERRVSRLIARGADLSLTARQGITALGIAVEQGLAAESLELANAGAPFATSRPGEGIVEKALSLGHRDLAEMLWLNGAGLSGWASKKYDGIFANGRGVRSSSGDCIETGTALHWASLSGSAPIVLELLERMPRSGAGRIQALNAPTAIHGPEGPLEGRTALALAAESGAVEVVNALIAAGARVGAKSSTPCPGAHCCDRFLGMSILAIAAMSESVDTARIILSAQAWGQDEIDEAFWRASMAGPEMMRLFRPSCVKKFGAAPLAMAIERGLFIRYPGSQFSERRLGAIQELLAMGAPVNEAPGANSGPFLAIDPCPLRLAVSGGCADLVEMLLAAGADPWVLDKDGDGLIDLLTARLHPRTPSGHFDAPLLLLDIVSNAMIHQDSERAERVFSRSLAKVALCSQAQNDALFASIYEQSVQFLANRRNALREARLIGASLPSLRPMAPRESPTSSKGWGRSL